MTARSYHARKQADGFSSESNNIWYSFDTFNSYLLDTCNTHGAIYSAAKSHDKKNTWKIDTFIVINVIRLLKNNDKPVYIFTDYDTTLLGLISRE